jgi:hypothetical protein
VVLRRYSNRSVNAITNPVGNYPSTINSQMISAMPSPVNLPVSTESFSQEISNGASKLLQLLARVLTEPISDRPINHHWQQIHDSNTDSSLKLTITVNLSMAD